MRFAEFAYHLEEVGRKVLCSSQFDSDRLILRYISMYIVLRVGFGHG